MKCSCLLVSGYTEHWCFPAINLTQSVADYYEDSILDFIAPIHNIYYEPTSDMRPFSCLDN